MRTIKIFVSLLVCVWMCVNEQVCACEAHRQATEDELKEREECRIKKNMPSKEPSTFPCS